MRFRDPQAHRQPQPGAFADELRREERLEDPRRRRRAARPAHRRRSRGRRALAGRRRCARAACPGWPVARVACSALRIRLRTTCWISSRLTMISGSSAAYCSSRAISCARRSVARQASVARTISLRSATDRSSADLRANVSRLRTIFAARSPATRISSRSRARLRPVLRADHQLEVAHHALQRVVQLVRDAGDELADRRQPLAVDQLLAQAALLRDVALDRDEVRRPCRARRAARPRSPTTGKRRSVGARRASPCRARCRRRARPTGCPRPRSCRWPSGRAAAWSAAPRACSSSPGRTRRSRGGSGRPPSCTRIEILRLLDHLRQQPHRRARLLQLGALGGDARDEQRQHGDDRDRRRQIAEAGERLVRRDAPQAVVEEREQRDRREDDPRARPRELLVLGVGGVGLVRRRRQRRGPREERERQDPGEVVDERACDTRPGRLRRC